MLLFQIVSKFYNSLLDIIFVVLFVLNNIMKFLLFLKITWLKILRYLHFFKD